MAKKATQKARNLKNNRRRGNSYEVKIAKEIRELGFTGVVTSRSESKAMDDKKVDFIDTENKLPVYLQAKKTIQTPNYLKIQSECPLKDKPFVIIWNSQKATESTFRSLGEVAIMQKDFFYQLLKLYSENGNSSSDV